jgi:hypothetical protein
LLPNFFLLGPPKAGTTALAEALARHPDVFMSTPKEPNYFLYAGGNPYGLPLNRGVPDFDAYQRLFEGAGAARIRGDASPYYIYAPHSALEIARLAPDARLLVVLRNPVERAYSAYRYWHKDAPNFRCDPEDFRERLLSRSLVTDQGRGRAGVLPMEWLQDMGRYADMIERYDAHFSPDQIMLLRYDDLAADSAGAMNRVLKFLDVDPDAAPELRQVNVTFEPAWPELNHWLNFAVDHPARRVLTAQLRGSRLAAGLREGVNRVNRRPVPTSERPLPASIYNELIEVYADDLRRLERRANLDLTDWLTPRRDEPGPGERTQARGRTAAAPPRSMGPTPPLARQRGAASQGWWSRAAARLTTQVAIPVALMAAAVAYWIWPADLIPDASQFGRVDDVACVIVLGALAARLTLRRSVR